MLIPATSRIFCGPALVLGILAADSASAADMGFLLENEHRQPVAIELHGKDRAWPGDNQVYLLGPGDIKKVTISCTTGERICYGAWINGNDRVAFGVGPDNDRTCHNCCSICVGQTMETIDLTP